MFFLDLECLPLCIYGTGNISASGYTMTLPLKIKNLLRTNRNLPELGKTTLKYTNLFSLISKILGSYIWVFTVFVRHFTR